MDNKKIGLFIKELRIREGLSQKNIAEICKISHQAVSKWEKGESLPDISSLQLLSSYYNITINEILDAKIDESRGKYKPFNNRNKEIIKITMSIFMIFVSFLPFYTDLNDVTFMGFGVLGKVEFGLGIMTYVTMLAYITFQITFSLFTIFRIISFSKGNVYLNRGVTVIMAVMVWFTLALSEFEPYPFIIYLIYLLSLYLISSRVLKSFDDENRFGKTKRRYEPYAYIMFYVLILMWFPLYLLTFNEWFRNFNTYRIIVFILLVVSIASFIIGYYLYHKNRKISLLLKHVSVYSMRIVYVLLYLVSYMESYFYLTPISMYDGMMVVIVYIGFELLISSKYTQSIKQTNDIVPLFQTPYKE